MKITNNTKYNGTQLRKLILGKLKEMGITPKGYSIYIDYRARKNQRMALGQAYLNSKWMRITMTKGEQNLSQFLNIVEHEALHNLGIKHEDMHPSIRYAYTTGTETIKEIQPKPKPKRDLVAERYAHIKQKRAEWKKKLERAEKTYLKWNKARKQYYARHSERLNNATKET